MQPDLTAGIVRILHPDGSTAGTGFVVSANGLIATCSHVVQSEHSQRDGEPRPERVTVVFQATGEQRQAIVEPAWWRPYDAGDIAILRVEGDLPEGIHPLPLGPSKKASGHPFVSRGYRLTEHFPGGLDAEGRIQSVTSFKGQPALQLLTNQIDKGMSGAPVLDTHARRVVGMVNFFWETQRHVDAWLAGAVPAETLKAVCDALTLRLPQPVEDYLTALGQFCRDLPYVSLDRDVPLTTVYVRQQMRRKPDDKRQPDDERAQLEAIERRERPIPIEEALTQHARLLVVGGPGAGKSTLLRHLVEEQLVEENDARDGARFTLRSSTAHLPILVSLRGLAGREGDVTTCLRQQIEAELGKRLPNTLSDDFLKEWAEQTGAAWLIALDGLDEILDAERRRALLKELAQTAWPPGSRIVLTSRPDESLPTGDTISPFDLLPFEPAQVEAFARNWFKDETLAGAFLRSVQRSTLRAVTSIPLLLTVAAIVFEDEAKKQTATDVGVLAPDATRGLADIRRVTLYDRFVTILLKEDRTANRRMKEQFCEQFRRDLGETLFDYRREVLECVALAMQEARDVETALIEFLGRLPRWSEADARRKAAEVLNILVQQRTGLAAQRGAAYDFIHPTFREYLAAAAIVRTCEKDQGCIWQRAISRWQDKHWREVALLALSILIEEGTDVTHLLERILRERIPWRKKEALYFVGAAIGEQVRVSPDFAAGVIGSLLDIARRVNWLDKFQEPKALVVLAELRAYPLVADGVLALARDERVDAGVRTEAAEALGKLGQADNLLALARDERVHAKVRREAAVALSELGWAEEAVPILLALARDERVDTWVRMRAAEALGRLGQVDEAVPILLALARDERVNVWVRSVAAEALGRLGQVDEAVPILLALARDVRVDPDIAVALGKLGRADDLLVLARDKRMETDVRRTAAYALGKLGRADDLLALARDKRANARVRMDAAEVLGKLGRADEVAPILLALMRDERVDAAVHYRAIQVLIELCRADDLLALARDERVNAQVRVAAQAAIQEINKRTGK